MNTEQSISLGASVASPLTLVNAIKLFNKAVTQKQNKHKQECQFLSCMSK